MKDNFYTLGLHVTNKIIELYDELIELEMNNNKKEYNEKVKILKNLIKIEDELYSKLSLSKIEKYLNSMTYINPMYDSIVMERYNDKLNYFRSIIFDITALEDDILLEDIIESKITLDALKLTKKEIFNFKTHSIKDEIKKKELKTFFEANKYDHLNTNSYLEKIALKYNFDIDKIPAYSFQDIEDIYGFNFINDNQNLFLKRCLNDISELNEIYIYSKELTNREIFLTSLISYEIKTIIPILSIEKLQQLSLYLNNISKNKNLNNINKFIKERKKDFI